MRSSNRMWVAAAAAAVMVVASAGAVSAGGDHKSGKHGERVSTVVDLSGPRGVHSVRPGVTLVTQDDGSFSVVIEKHAWHRHHFGKVHRKHTKKHPRTRVITLGSLPASAGFANAISGAGSKVFVLTSAGEPGSGAGSLYVWDWRKKHRSPRLLADIAAYQMGDPDPHNTEGDPSESNPYGVQALRDGTVLVADAAGNDLLRVWPSGKIRTVARLMPRTVEMPDGLPPTDPDGNPLPPAGTPIPAEAVATSVTVGSDGYWYVGELRGFPATTGTSQIWRIRPGSIGVDCNPEKPRHGKCTRYADGLTSIVDLASHRGSIFALSLSKQSWLAMEIGAPGSEVGGLFEFRHGRMVKEWVKDKLVLPGGVDVSAKGEAYVTGPVFGPGALTKVSRR